MNRRRSLLRVLPAIAIPLALFVGLVSWGFSSPIGSSPDDDYHLASIWCGSGIREGLCEPGGDSDERRVPATLIEYPSCYAFKAGESADCPQKPSSVMINTKRGNFEASYPPVFYGTLSIFAGPDIAASVLLMRAFNALLFVGVATLLFFTLARDRRGPLLWGGLATIVPLGMFLIPSVNPSSWAVISAMTLWISLVGYFQAEERRRRIIFATIAVLMTVAASGARGDAAAYSVLALVVAAILAFRRSAAIQLWKVAIVPVVIVATAALFFLVAGQSSVISPDTGPQQVSTLAGLLGLAASNFIQLPQLWVGALGSWGLGWLDTALPAIVWVSILAVFVGLLFWGLQKLDRRKGIALGLVFASLVIVPLYILVKDNVIVGVAVQPRYIYPLMIMLVGIALFMFARDDLAMSRTQIVSIAALVIAANAVALHTNIRRYVTGTDGQGPNLDKAAEWWWSIPISPMGTWAIGTVAFAVAVAGIVAYAVPRKDDIESLRP